MTMLKTPLAKMLRTTKQKLELLSKLGLFTVRDLLLYYPRAYEDKSVLSSISMFSVKHVNTSRGTLSPITKMTTKYGKKILKATFTDEQGASVECVWFGQFHLPQIWNRPKKVLVSGKVRWAMGKMTLQSPEVEEDTGDLLHAGGIIAVYHETEGISSKWLREKISTLVHACSEFEDILPLEISTEFGFPTKGDSLRAVHFPESDEQLDLARKMLSFEELYILQLQALRQKHLWEEQGAAAGVVMDSDLMKEFQSTLPFELTGAQKVSLFEILTDMASGKPMLRMLQGDVGSGKTIVAAMAILNASRQGYQCCVMSPTEILTKQHFQTMKTILPDCRIELLVGSMKESEKQEVRDSIAAGDVDLVIGTHALIQSSVQFRNLGLGVIDEQHRFGVEQRKRLAERSGTCVPHLLMMSATPIPRSLALTIYGDQDLSIIDEMPKGRKPIVTKVVHPGARYQSTLFIDDQIAL
jgi:ATP-dependent DNA helicase RecG